MFERIIINKIIVKIIGVLTLIWAVYMLKNLIALLVIAKTPEFRQPMLYLFVFRLFVMLLLGYCGIGLLFFKNLARRILIIFSSLWIILSLATALVKFKMNYPPSKIFGLNFLFILLACILILILSQPRIKEQFNKLSE